MSAALEYREYVANDTQYVGCLRASTEDGAVVSAMFVRDDPGHPHVFLNEKAIALLPPELASTFGGDS